ncbi:MAG: FAD/NAD(P)-binding protein [Acidobacteriota bacterium]
MSLDWLIIGGGIHGVHVATRLIGQAGVAADALRIIDPAPELLAQWRARTATTGMSHLRSPAVHHLDLESGALDRFAGRRSRRKSGLFAPPYDRPSLALFNAHCDHVVETYELGALHVQDRAVTCSVGDRGVAVELSSGRELVAENLLLAMGSGEQPKWPEWAPRDEPRVRHVFEPGFDGWPSSDETVAVVGGGISAGHVALRLLEEGHEVHLISRRALRQHQFDSEPGWLGPKRMSSFSRVRNVDHRRALITSARHVGSVPPDMWRALHGAISRERLQWHESGVEGLDLGSDGLELRLGDDVVVEADRVLLATGFASHRPGGAMIDALISSASLPCARCGYPIVDSALRWHPRIHVSGPLAELELGPVSRNIAGARRAGDRIVEAVTSGLNAATEWVAI